MNADSANILPTDPSRSLAQRMAVSFGLFTLMATLLLLAVFYHLSHRAEEQRLSALADSNTAFLEQSPLPLSEEMAARLGRVLRVAVMFSHRDTPSTWIGQAPAALLPALDAPELPSVQRVKGGYLLAKRELRSGARVAFLQRSEAEFAILWQLETWLAVGALWLLSLALAVWWAQRLARPVQRLAELVPALGQDKPLPLLPHAGQQDEIGSLARALGATHHALTVEREKRRAAERLALLGRMATSLAHEVRNPLAAVRLHAELLHGASEEETLASVALIRSETARLEALVSQWMHYARPAPPVLRHFDLASLVEAAVAVIAPQAAHAQVIVRVSKELPTYPVAADGERLQQVMLNVMLNAIQAMPEGGELVLSLSRQAQQVQLHLQDSGPGFSPTALAHLGEPFFSEREGGMGLGLSVAKEVLEAQGGRLSVANTALGACVTLTLPERSERI